VSAAAIASGFRRRLRTRRRALAVTGTRAVGKRHMLYNQANPRIEIDAATAAITIDGQPLPPLPDDDLPLNRRYFLM
jgi:urease subunit alpha